MHVTPWTRRIYQAVEDVEKAFFQQALEEIAQLACDYSDALNWQKTDAKRLP